MQDRPKSRPYEGAGTAPKPLAGEEDRATDPHPGSISDGTHPEAREVKPPEGSKPKDNR